MKIATKDAKIRSLCPAKVALGAKRENFIGSEEENYGVKTVFMSLNQNLGG